MADFAAVVPLVQTELPALQAQMEMRDLPEMDLLEGTEERQGQEEQPLVAMEETKGTAEAQGESEE